MQKILAELCLPNWAAYGRFHLNTTFQFIISNQNVFTWLSYSFKCSCSLKLCQPNCIHLAFLVSVYKLQLGQTVSFSLGGGLVQRSSTWRKINALNQRQFMHFRNTLAQEKCWITVGNGRGMPILSRRGGKKGGRQGRAHFKARRIASSLPPSLPLYLPGARLLSHSWPFASTESQRTKRLSRMPACLTLSGGRSLQRTIHKGCPQNLFAFGNYIY